MAFAARTRLVNPRLGTYYGIFASAFAAVVLMALLLEQLGTADTGVRAVMLALPVLFYAAIAILAATHLPIDFFAAGRRIPPFFNGLALAVAALGGTGFMAVTGTVFMIGVDGLALTIGWISGLVFSAVLLVPFLRKFGSYTLPSFLGQRFDSRALRITAAAIFTVPVLLMLVAEIRFAAFAASELAGVPQSLMIVVVVATGGIIVAAGGMRSLSWSTTAKGIAALLAIAVPATIVALMVSNLPLPQLTHGNLVRSIARSEVDRGIATLIASTLALDLPGLDPEPIAKRFLQLFGSISSTSFSALIFVVAAGIAGSPTLLTRAGTTPGVYDARKSLGWAVLLTGFALLTFAAVAVYLRGFLIEQVVGQPSGGLPAWFQTLQQFGLVSLDAKVPVVTLGSISVRRDGVLFALPIAAGFPRALVYLAMAGAFAASLAALSAALLTLGTMLAEDGIAGLGSQPPDDRPRIAIARGAIAVAGIAGLLLAFVRADPLDLAIWSLAFSAAASFPILVLSVLWKRLNAVGAMAGMVTGFAVTAAFIVAAEAGLIDAGGPLGAIPGMIAAVAVAGLVARLTPPPDRQILERVRDMRVPGGETIHDRQVRIARMKHTPV